VILPPLTPPYQGGECLSIELGVVTLLDKEEVLNSPLLDKEEVLNSPLLDKEGWGAVD